MLVPRIISNVAVSTRMTRCYSNSFTPVDLPNNKFILFDGSQKKGIAVFKEHADKLAQGETTCVAHLPEEGNDAELSAESNSLVIFAEYKKRLDLLARSDANDPFENGSIRIKSDDSGNAIPRVQNPRRAVQITAALNKEDTSWDFDTNFDDKAASSDPNAAQQSQEPSLNDNKAIQINQEAFCTVSTSAFAE